MSTQQQQQQQQEKLTPANVMGGVWAASNVLFICFGVFTRQGGFGKQAFGWHGLAALLLLLFLAAGSPPMQLFFIAWIIAVITQRRQTMKLLSQGAVLHSKSQGFPFTARWFSGDNAYMAEAMCCFASGMLLVAVSPVLGGFIVSGFVALVVKHGIEKQIQNSRRQRLSDAKIEAQWLTEDQRFRPRW